MTASNDIAMALLPIAGVRLATVSAGIKVAGRPDLVLLEVAQGANIAAVFTRNAFCAAPVTLARQHLGQAQARLLLINTGNANAGTGQHGLDNALRCCAEMAEIAGLQAAQVLPFSTGVIGEPLPVDTLCAALPGLHDGLLDDGWLAAAEGILTTDTRPKGASRQIACQDGELRLTGIAKGAGMIKPNMATMLSYVATDARINQVDLQAAWQRAVEYSFNRITVDGDTSTNDAAILIASGVGPVSLDASHADWPLFTAALESLAIELAQAIVKDGEGASKFVTVEVSGGSTADECLAVAYTVAESPLVKTALFASDANWGRILAAVGRAGVAQLQVEGVKLWINDVLIAEAGARAANYREADGTRAMAEPDIHMRIDLGRGDCTDTVWTTDLSHDYIRINAEYRT